MLSGTNSLLYVPFHKSMSYIKLSFFLCSKKRKCSSDLYLYIALGREGPSQDVSGDACEERQGVK